MSYTFGGFSPRVAESKLAASFGKQLSFLLMAGAVIMLAAGIGVYVTGQHKGMSLVGVSMGLGCAWAYVKWRVLALRAMPFATSSRLEEILPPDLLSRFRPGDSAEQLWAAVASTWQAKFMMARFGIHPDDLAAAITGSPLTLDQIWTEAGIRAQAADLIRLTNPAIMAAFIVLTPTLQELLTTLKLDQTDINEGVAWLGRLEHFEAARNPNYGGIGRDWAAGFTPTLSRFGENISRQIELGGSRFGIQERTNQLDSLVAALSSANGSVALIGEAGIGKTALLYGLADRLLQGKAGRELNHHQIFSLNASLILGQQESAGDIEHIVLSLMGEAVHAGNIVIALDEAQLFFGQGTGAVNLSQVLLPVLQARSLKLVLGLTPGDWQRLKSTNSAMTGMLTPLVLTEPPQTDVIRLLADRSLILEGGRLTTTYQALIEAYRLSGRYFQDTAYPGKALKLLEAALNYPINDYITEVSIQKAVESQIGVKVQQASADETGVLLNLEDRIHERMINQTRAVGVVASALRRARAGVSNPKRPIGSFLFLGPTGVGKTELARSLAALYFGSEHNMIRLDMSEYQQVADVSRLLASAADNPDGLLAKVRTSPFSVILFDEIEKAHPNILNLFLQLFDEGNLTDSSNKPASFKDAIVIATSNAGSDEIRRHIDAGEELEAFEDEFVEGLMGSGLFKPELLNRFDEIVLFRPLKPNELVQVVKLMISEVNLTLGPQKIQVELTEEAMGVLVAAGYDPRLGARPLRRMVQRRVEDAVAGQILRGQAKAGSTIHLGVEDMGGAPAQPVAAASDPVQPSAAPPPKATVGDTDEQPKIVS